MQWSSQLLRFLAGKDAVYDDVAERENKISNDLDEYCMTLPTESFRCDGMVQDIMDVEPSEDEPGDEQSD